MNILNIISQFLFKLYQYIICSLILGLL